MKDVLSRVCLWDDDWNVGDYRFCVLSYDLPGEVAVYLQFWSEPGDVVIWEVSSGKWHEPTEGHIAGHRGQRIAAPGFELGGEAENYQKIVEVQTPRDVAALAREVTALLYDALDYRGQQALDVQAVADSRAMLRPVYASIEPHDLARIFELAGYKCEVGDEVEDADAANVPVYVRRYGIRAVAMLIVRSPDDTGFEVVGLGLAVPPSGGSMTPVVDGAELRLLWLAGGVTASWLEHQVADWFNDQRQERKRTRSKRTATPLPKASRSIH